MTLVELSLFGIPLILISSAMLGFFTAYGVGANDVANAMGTSVGSKVLTIKQAVLVAAVFEFLGAFLAGGGVTQTIRKGVIDPALFEGNLEVLIYGMISALFAAVFDPFLRVCPLTWLAYLAMSLFLVGLSGSKQFEFLRLTPD